MERNCQHCKWRIQEKDLIGIVNICRVEEKPVRLDGYCQYFRERKRGNENV